MTLGPAERARPANLTIIGRSQARDDAAPTEAIKIAVRVVRRRRHHAAAVCGDVGTERRALTARSFPAARQTECGSAHFSVELCPEATTNTCQLERRSGWFAQCSAAKKRHRECWTR